MADISDFLNELSDRVYPVPARGRAGGVRASLRRYRLNTVRSAVIDGMKKYAAAVSTTNWCGMASVVRRFPAG
jgi:hypothetical protein